MSSLGTELKINIHIDQLDNYKMKDIDFVCRFFIYADKYIELTKEEMIHVDDDNYMACVDSSKLGVGEIKVRITAQIPDSDFDDGYRQEVVTATTGIIISK